MPPISLRKLHRHWFHLTLGVVSCPPFFLHRQKRSTKRKTNLTRTGYLPTSRRGSWIYCWKNGRKLVYRLVHSTFFSTKWNETPKIRVQFLFKLPEIHPSYQRFSQEIPHLRHCQVTRLLYFLVQMVQNGPSPPFIPQAPQRHRRQRSASHATGELWRPTKKKHVKTTSHEALNVEKLVEKTTI